MQYKYKAKILSFNVIKQGDFQIYSLWVEAVLRSRELTVELTNESTEYVANERALAIIIIA